MHAIIENKKAIIRHLQSKKFPDKHQIAGLKKSILLIEKQAAEHTEELYSQKMLTLFSSSLFNLNQIAKHWKTLDLAVEQYNSETRNSNWFIYHSPLDNSYMVIDMQRVNKIFQPKKAAIAIDFEHRSNSGIFSKKQIGRVTRRLNNIETSFYAYLARRTVNISEYSVPVIPEPLYPSEILLTEFHVCGRKQLYATLDKATKSAIRNNLEVYVCVFCTGYHIGHGSDDNDYRYLIGSQYYARHRHTWKRYPEKAAAFLAERGIVL